MILYCCKLTMQHLLLPPHWPSKWQLKYKCVHLVACAYNITVSPSMELSSETEENGLLWMQFITP